MTTIKNLKRLLAEATPIELIRLLARYLPALLEVAEAAEKAAHELDNIDMDTSFLEIQDDLEQALAKLQEPTP